MVELAISPLTQERILEYLYQNYSNDFIPIEQILIADKIPNDRIRANISYLNRQEKLIDLWLENQFYTVWTVSPYKLGDYQLKARLTIKGRNYVEDRLAKRPKKVYWIFRSENLKWLIGIIITIILSVVAMIFK
jgi:hypothetical protein